tara:strand:+ start:7412 stop:8299 length:888 start_codon:yes stop_codon:yes gene_type:complete
MTCRSGNMTEERLRLSRCKTLVQCIEITQLDDTLLRITDHDRKITVEGHQYLPIVLAELSADKREASLRHGQQMLRAVVDGNTITIPNLKAQKFRNARVRILLLDYTHPQVVYTRMTRYISDVRFDGSNAVGTMYSQTNKLQRPSGGRFGGNFSKQCQYVLAGPFCKADIAAEVVASAAVESITDQRTELVFTAATFSPPTAAQEDNYYRDGSLIWKTGNNVGNVSPIVSSSHSLRKFKLLIPTARDIQVGDTCEIKPGCNGLFTTCKDKFGNAANFGGSDLEPDASSIRAPVIE